MSRRTISLGVVAVAFVVAISLVVVGFTSTSAPPPAPLPSHTFHAPTAASDYQAGPVVAPVVKTATPPAKLSANTLSIPSLGVTAGLTPESITANSLSVPSNVREVGIWTGGAQLDQTNGTVLVVGHVDYYDQGHGALYHLADISEGSPIFVTDGFGHPTAWTVVSLAAVPKSDLPQSIFDPSGPRQLVIVTCGGPFDSATGHYVDNVIVTAVPASVS